MRLWCPWHIRVKEFQNAVRKKNLQLMGRIGGLGFTSINVMVEAIDKVKAAHRLCRRAGIKQGAHTSGTPKAGQQRRRRERAQRARSKQRKECCLRVKG